MRVKILIVASCTALMLMSCSAAVQNVDIKAEGTIQFQLADGELLTVDIAKCWQRSFYAYSDGHADYLLDVVCDGFSIHSEFDTFPPEGQEQNDFPFRIFWNEERLNMFSKRCVEGKDYWFSAIYPRKVTVSKHNGEAPYTYHLTTNPLTNAPDEEACAVYDVKVRVLSEPSGDSYDPPDLPPEAYGQ